MIDLFLKIGSSVCHQLGERSLHLGEYVLPVCARCTGIYISFFISFIYLIFTKGYRGNKPFKIRETLFMVICLLPLMVDGVGSYIGFWQSNNLLRIITGSLAGFVVLPFMVLIYNFSPQYKNDKYIFKKSFHIYLIGFIAVSLGALLYLGVFDSLYYIIYIVISLGIVIYYSSIFCVIIKLLFSKLSDKYIILISIIFAITIITVVSYIIR